MSTKLAERVTATERELTALKAQLAGRSDAGGSEKDWRKTIGAFRDDHPYDDMVRLGSAYRKRQPKC